MGNDTKSEMVRRAAGVVLAELLEHTERSTVQLLCATQVSRITLDRAIRHVREQGVRVFYERGGRQYYMRDEDRTHHRALLDTPVRLLIDVGMGVCLALESRREAKEAAE